MSDASGTTDPNGVQQPNPAGGEPPATPYAPPMTPASAPHAPPSYGPGGVPDAQPTYPGAQPTYPGAQPAYSGAQPGYPGAQPGYPAPQPSPGASPQASYPGYSGTPLMAAKKPAGLAIGFAVAALVVGLLNVGIVLALLAWASTATGDDIAAALGISIVLGGIGLLITFALAVTALIIAIRRRHTASIVMAALAIVSSIAIGAIVVSTVAVGAARLDEEENLSSAPSPSSTDDTGFAPDGDTDPLSIAWDNGDLAGTGTPALVWDDEVNTWETSALGDDAVIAADPDTTCEARISVQDLAAPTTAVDDESASVTTLTSNVPDADPANLFDIDMYWLGSSDADSLVFVMAETQTADTTTMSAYRVLNSATALIEYVVTCPQEGPEGITAVEDAHNAVWNALSIREG